MSTNSIKVGLIQMACSENPATNLEKAIALIEQGAREGATVLCLPELFLSPYFCKTEDVSFFQLAESIPGPTTNALLPIAKKHDVVIIASLFEERTIGLYHNTTAVIDGQKGYIGKYRKMHIPDDPLFYEKFYFAPGDLGFKNFETTKGNLGVLICWDQWYPEAARLTALQGASVLFYPTAIGWLPEDKIPFGKAQHEAWETMQRAHAIANGCFVVAVNRVGIEPEPNGNSSIEFWGQSFVVAPNGQILQRASSSEETVLIQELDLNQIATLRHGWPFFRDRRIDAYSGITKRFGDAP